MIEQTPDGGQREKLCPEQEADPTYVGEGASITNENLLHALNAYTGLHSALRGYVKNHPGLNEALKGLIVD